MARAIKILGWKNDFIREKADVHVDPTDKQIVERVSSILGKGESADMYKRIFLTYTNEMENKDYDTSMPMKKFVDVLIKEKMIEIVDPYVPEPEPERPKADPSNIRPELKKFWAKKSDESTSSPSKEPDKTTGQTRLPL